jgi:hypothetical protein
MPPAPAMAAASPPSAAVLAAAALAARKSGAAVQGRLTKRSLLSKAAKAPAPAPSPVASAALAGGSSGQRPTTVQLLPAGMRSEPRLAASDLPKTPAAASALGQMLTVAAVSTASGLLPSPSSLVSDKMSTCLIVEELVQQSVLMFAGSSPAPMGCCPPSADGCAASSRQLPDADLLCATFH